MNENEPCVARDRLATSSTPRHRFAIASNESLKVKPSMSHYCVCYENESTSHDQDQFFRFVRNRVVFQLKHRFTWADLSSYKQKDLLNRSRAASAPDHNFRVAPVLSFWLLRLSF